MTECTVYMHSSLCVFKNARNDNHVIYEDVTASFYFLSFLLWKLVSKYWLVLCPWAHHYLYDIAVATPLFTSSHRISTGTLMLCNILPHWPPTLAMLHIFAGVPEEWSATGKAEGKRRSTIAEWCSQTAVWFCLLCPSNGSQVIVIMLWCTIILQK